jgi:hypothetical protein
MFPMMASPRCQSDNQPAHPFAQAGLLDIYFAWIARIAVTLKNSGRRATGVLDS